MNLPVKRWKTMLNEGCSHSSLWFCFVRGHHRRTLSFLWPETQPIPLLNLPRKARCFHQGSQLPLELRSRLPIRRV